MNDPVCGASAVANVLAKHSADEIAAALGALPREKLGQVQLALHPSAAPRWGDALPDEIVVHIMEYCQADLPTLLALRLVSRRFCRLTARVSVVLSSRPVWTLSERRSNQHLKWMSNPKWWQRTAQLFPSSPAAGAGLAAMFPRIGSVHLDMSVLREPVDEVAQLLASYLSRAVALPIHATLSNDEIGGLATVAAATLRAQGAPLISVELRLCHVTDKCADELARFPISQVALFGRHRNAESYAGVINKWAPTLRQLHVSCCAPTVVPAMQRCTHLTELHIVNPQCVVDVSALQRLACLKELGLQHHCTAGEDRLGDSFVVNDCTVRLPSVRGCYLCCRGSKPECDTATVNRILALVLNTECLDLGRVCLLTKVTVQSVASLLKHLTALRIELDVQTHLTTFLLRRPVIKCFQAMNLSVLALPVFAFSRAPPGCVATAEWRAHAINTLCKCVKSLSACGIGPVFWDMPPRDLLMPTSARVLAYGIDNAQKQFRIGNFIE